MKKYTALIAAAAALVVAAPAAANEARGEARSGIAWAAGEEEMLVGVAFGYDFDLGDSAFVGVEGSADKLLVDGADVVWGGTVRAGAKLGEGKLYVAGGYSISDVEAFHLGAGYQHKIGPNSYLKAEYRRFFDVIDVNVVAAGVGVTF